MMNFIEKHDVILKVLCVLISMLIWVYVIGIKNEDVSGVYKNIKVELQNEERILNDYGLIIVSGKDSTASVELSGKRADMISIDEGSDIRAVADVSVISSKGVHNILYNTILSSPEISIVGRSPQYITIKTDRIEYTEVPIDVIVSGTPAEGCFYGNALKAADTVTIYGASEEIDRVEYARGIVYAEGLSESSDFSAEYELYDINGNVVSSEFVYRQSNSLQVTLPVTRIVSCPVEVTIESARGLNGMNADVSVSPEYIDITGNEDALSGIRTINAGTVYLEDVDNEKDYTFSVVLPEGVINVDGINLVRVHVKLMGIVKSEVRTENIFVNYQSDLYDVELITKSISAKFRGHESVVGSVTGDDITVYADFSDEQFKNGQIEEGFYTVAADVVIDESADVMLIGDYSVIVKVTKKPNAE